jgi:hypothetical protein
MIGDREVIHAARFSGCLSIAPGGYRSRYGWSTASILLPSNTVPEVPCVVREVRAQISVHCEGEDFSVIDTRMAIAYAFDMYHADVRDPANPKQLSHTLTKGNAMRLTFAGNILSVANGTGGLTIFDVSDAKDPQRKGTLSW